MRKWIISNDKTLLHQELKQHLQQHLLLDFPSHICDQNILF